MLLLKTIFKWLFAILLIFLFLKVNNEYIVTTSHEVISEEIPASFDGFKIVQVSDLHDAMFGDRNERLITKVEQQQPDVIFITGDIIDSRRYKLEQSIETAEQLVAIAPTYFVTGNHEIATNEYLHIYSELEKVGVQTLKNEVLQLSKGADTLKLIGLEDPLMGYNVEQQLSVLTSTSDYTILLSHRPELFEAYVAAKVDIVFAGHAHGGQIRIPFLLDGMFSPGQGWLPKYTAGMYEELETTMFVSRGLGNSAFQQRLFNLPELVSVTLKSAE